MSEITMRSANVVRHIEWSNGEGDGTEFYAVELFGEAGELLNVVKKLERERLGMVGSRVTEQDLAEELADVVICVDLLAMAYKMPVTRPSLTAASPGDHSDLMIAISLGRATGDVMGWVEEIETAEIDFQWHREAMMTSMEEIVGYAGVLADRFNIDLALAIVAKFNKTSAKYGLTTRMAPNASFF